MKPLKFLLPLLAVTALFVLLSPRTARADGGVSADFFYSALDPYGEWIELPDHGYCWHPSGVDENWAPYTDGYWAYTDAGWTWVSYEDWGGITYHYGRWTLIDGLGWCWVPGYEWGPAWVSWRSNDDYIGWAPLPPEVGFDDSVGIGIWVDVTWGIGPGCYNFCRYRDFGAPALRPCIIRRDQNILLIGKTLNITNIAVNHSRHVVFNGGPDYHLVQERSSRPIQTLRLVQQSDVNAARTGANGLFSKQHGNQLEVFAPTISHPTGETPRPKNVARVMETANTDKGWSHVPAAQAQQLKSKINQQTSGLAPEKMQARPVTDRELKVIGINSAKAPLAQPASQPGKSQPSSPSTALQQETARPTPPVNDKYRSVPTQKQFIQPATGQAVEQPRPQSQTTVEPQQDTASRDLQRRQQQQRQLEAASQQKEQERAQLLQQQKQQQLERQQEQQQPRLQVLQPRPSPAPQAQQQRQTPAQNDQRGGSDKRKGSPTPAPGQ